ncbi:TPA: DUF1642 domain-containing protein, partial [Streptococcus suis]|nr:DUF1642 domain-containing protein [Streptococcus suis]
ADSIEYCKNEEGYGLLRAMDYCDEYNDTGEWLERPENQETFACAWLFGFEIEQEKLYTVEIPDPNSAGIVTFLHKKKRRFLSEIISVPMKYPKMLGRKTQAPNSPNPKSRKILSGLGMQGLPRRWSNGKRY